jgi:hypothetical protein
VYHGGDCVDDSPELCDRVCGGLVGEFEVLLVWDREEFEGVWDFCVAWI